MKLNNLKNLNQLAQAAQKKQPDGKVILTVPVDEVISKEQVRKRFRNIEELGDSILEEGQQSAIVVYPKNEDGKYVIQKGERRWRACKAKDIPTIDIVVNEKEQTDLDETAGELIENIQRDDLTALEIANALQVFIDKGWQQKDVAKRIGKNTIFVSTHLSLLKMPDCVRELYDNDITADTETLNNLRLLFELNEERCRAVCAVAMSDGMTRKQSRELLNDAKRIKNGDEPTSNEDGAVTNNSEQDNNSNSDSELGEEKGGNFTQSDVESSDDTTGDNVVHQATGEEFTSDDASSQGDTNAPGDKQVDESDDSTDDAEEEGIEPPLAKGKDWKGADPRKLVITVNIIGESENKRGVLMTDRIATEPNVVWVKTLVGEKKEVKPIKVAVTDIELVSVE